MSIRASLRAGAHSLAWAGENPLSAWFVGLSTAITIAVGLTLAVLAVGGTQALTPPIDLAAALTAMREASLTLQAAAVAALALAGLAAQGVVMRALTGGSDSQRLMPRLGQDELRLIWCWVLGAIALSTPPALLGGAGLAWGLSTELPVLAPAGAAIGGLISVVFLVRFSQSAAATVARRRLSFFHSWDASLGRFWSLLFAYLVAFVFAALFAGMIVAAGAVAVHGFDPVLALEAAKADGPALLMTPMVALPLMLVSGLVLLITAGPAAFAYQLIDDVAEQPMRSEAPVGSGMAAEVLDG